MLKDSEIRISVPKLKIILSVMLVVLLGSCFWNEERVLSISNDGVIIEATISDTLMTLAQGTQAVGGQLRITNTGSVLVQYSNQELLLFSGDLYSRAYIDSFASHAIDFSHMAIEPGATLDLEVYWPIQESSVEFEALEIRWEK